MNTPPILSVATLTMRFGGLPRSTTCRSTCRPARSPAVIGPNGAGKTTFFNCLTGFYKPTTGSVRLNHPQRGEMRLEPCPATRSRATAQVVRTFQNIRLFPKMTVLENLIVAQHNVLQRASRFSIAGLFGCRLPQGRARGDRARAVDWLERLNLIDKADDAAGDLPYGTSGASRSRARCASIRCCSASTSRRPASTRASRPNSTSCCSSANEMKASPSC
jgi:branched-chain amino acid transport system ATP-binding protein